MLLDVVPWRWGSQRQIQKVDTESVAMQSLHSLAPARQYL